MSLSRDQFREHLTGINNLMDRAGIEVDHHGRSIRVGKTVTPITTFTGRQGRGPRLDFMTASHDAIPLTRRRIEVSEDGLSVSVPSLQEIQTYNNNDDWHRTMHVDYMEPEGRSRLKDLSRLEEALNYSNKFISKRNVRASLGKVMEARMPHSVNTWKSEESRNIQRINDSIRDKGYATHLLKASDNRGDFHTTLIRPRDGRWELED